MLDFHYVQEYYWYARRCLEIIIGGEDGARERVKELEDEYSELFARMSAGGAYSIGTSIGICERLGKSDKEEDREEALKMARRLAKKGEPEAQYCVGI